MITEVIMKKRKDLYIVCPGGLRAEFIEQNGSILKWRGFLPPLSGMFGSRCIEYIFYTDEEGKVIDEKYIKKVVDLTDEEQQEFAELFYEKMEAMGINPDDGESPNPWGCPWNWNEDLVLHGKTMEEMVEAYIKLVKDEIISILQENNEEE
jgi:hypothetical protein